MRLLPVVWWLSVCLGLALAGRPIAARLFPDFPDRGAAFAFPVGLGVVTLVTLWVGRLDRRLGLVVGVVVLAVLAVRTADTTPGDPREWRRRDVLSGSRTWLVPVGVFLAAFALLLAVRASNPGIVPTGGEKFLDYSLVRAVLRAETLPPEDPWFAGRPVRYYYGGHLAVAVLTELSGVRPSVAYNLAVATAYAALATAAYGLAAAVADGTDRVSRPHLAGALGALFTAFGGPLATPARAVLGLVPRDLAVAFGGPLIAGVRARPRDALNQVRYLSDGTLSGFDPWLGRYVVPDVPSVFPMWTFVNGDLRAHMVGPMFLLFGVAATVAVHRSDDRRRRLAFAFGVVPPTAGLLAVVNTWSLPVVGGVLALALAAADVPPWDLLPARLGRRFAALDGAVAELARPVVAVALALVALVLAGLWGAPFLSRPAPVNRGIALLPPRSPLLPPVASRPPASSPSPSPPCCRCPHSARPRWSPSSPPAAGRWPASTAATRRCWSSPAPDCCWSANSSPRGCTRTTRTLPGGTPSTRSTYRRGCCGDRPPASPASPRSRALAHAWPPDACRCDSGAARRQPWSSRSCSASRPSVSSARRPSSTDRPTPPIAHSTAPSTSRSGTRTRPSSSTGSTTDRGRRRSSPARATGRTPG
ncbi:hypothetical protein BRD18_00190 [Halobacteriales archaeon SW_7_71_33]|nr:MAG: hypothetical protein BRD18_00190 [Halobacteriales archaeon SW_7_71_33]